MPIPGIVILKKIMSKMRPKAHLRPRLDIRKAIKRPGQLHRDLNIPLDKKIPVKTLHQAAKMPDKVGQRARFALTLRNLRLHRK